MGYDDTVRLWEVATGTCCDGWEEMRAEWPVVAFSPSGELLAHAVDEVVLVLRDWHRDAASHAAWPYRASLGLDLSPTEPILASCGNDGTIRLWDADSGACLQILRAARPVCRHEHHGRDRN